MLAARMYEYHKPLVLGDIIGRAVILFDVGGSASGSANYGAAVRK